jgi:hypothetical protein
MLFLIMSPLLPKTFEWLLPTILCLNNFYWAFIWWL